VWVQPTANVRSSIRIENRVDPKGAIFSNSHSGLANGFRFTYFLNGGLACMPSSETAPMYLADGFHIYAFNSVFYLRKYTHQTIRYYKNVSSVECQSVWFNWDFPPRYSYCHSITKHVWRCSCAMPFGQASTSLVPCHFQHRIPLRCEWRHPCAKCSSSPARWFDFGWHRINPAFSGSQWVNSMIPVSLFQ
jgi:hypothetical protein